MAEHDGLRERGRALEEEYFRRKDRELLERMRQAADAEKTRAALGATTGVTDPEVLEEMAALGFTPDTVSLLPLVPVLQVAWAEGGVSAAERLLIVKLARARDIDEDSPAGRQLEQWLDTRPDAKVFDGATRLVRAMLDAHPANQATVEADDLVRQCEQVAEASGSFLSVLSLRRISPEERALLTTISAGLKRR